MFSNEILTNILLVVICITLSYILGMTIVKVIDKRLSHFEIKMPKQKLTHEQVLKRNSRIKEHLERMDKINKEYEERMNKMKKEYEELVLYIYGTVIPPGAYTFDEFCDNYRDLPAAI